MRLVEFLERNMNDYISIDNFYGNGGTSGKGAELLKAPHIKNYLNSEIEITTNKGECDYLDYVIVIK